jgi:trafficking protein particle complex subunit 12
VLETALRRDPLAGLHETLVFNLSTLYELESEGAVEKKKSVMVQAAKLYGDHFPLEALKSV